MFQNSGLSLKQAPPISVVLRFFLLASIFGIASGIWLGINGALSVNPSSKEGLIMTHFLTLGVMLSFMIGALFQMLPVLAGISMENPTQRAIRTQYPMILGIIFLLSGFYTSNSILFIFAGALLAIAILPVTLWMLKRLLDLPSHSSSSRGMGFAIFNLVLVIFLGLVLVGFRSGLNLGDYMHFREAHISFGIFGWISLLIISVSFQVIEMFFVTPPYPKKYAKYLPFAISALLTLDLISALNFPYLMHWIESLISLLLLSFALLTLKRLSQRGRPITDASVWFWRVGLYSLALFSILAIIDLTIPLSYTFNILLATLFTIFAISIVFAMVYKIVPFLTWFHLNAQGYFTAPMMHEVIHPKYAKRHLIIHLITIFLAIVSIIYPKLWSCSGIFLAISFAWLSWAIYRAWNIYKDTQENGEKIDLGAFGA